MHPLVGRASFWLLDEVRIFFAEPESERGILERKQVSSVLSGPLERDEHR